MYAYVYVCNFIASVPLSEKSRTCCESNCMTLYYYDRAKFISIWSTLVPYVRIKFVWISQKSITTLIKKSILFLHLCTYIPMISFAHIFIFLESSFWPSDSYKFSTRNKWSNKVTICGSSSSISFVVIEFPPMIF